MGKGADLKRKALFPGSVNKRLKKLKESLPQICVECGATKNLTLDHIVPVGDNGAVEDINNLQILCEYCNNKKGNKSTEIIALEKAAEKALNETISTINTNGLTQLSDFARIKKLK